MVKISLKLLERASRHDHLATHISEDIPKIKSTTLHLS